MPKRKHRNIQKFHECYQTKIPPLGFGFELDLFLPALLEELLFFEEDFLNLRCIMARRFFLLVKRIPKNMTAVPTSIVVPNPYFNLFVKESPAPDVSLDVVRCP
jgi:hypothetical protein